MTKRGRTLGVVGFAIALVAVANAAVLRGGRDDRPLEGPADCALVLGAGVRDDGTPSDVLRDRLDEAFDLWSSGRVPRILVSGDHARKAYDEPNTMRAYLESRGVPREVIFMDHAGLDTYSSVWRARNVFGASRVVIVTQRFHLPRALWVARALGMDAEGRAADHHVYVAAAWLEAREVISRTKATFDVTIGRAPRHAGPAIPLDGDGRVTAG